MSSFAPTVTGVFHRSSPDVSPSLTLVSARICDAVVKRVKAIPSVGLGKKEKENRKSVRGKVGGTESLSPSSPASPCTAETADFPRDSAPGLGEFHGEGGGEGSNRREVALDTA